jgi:truncated hemoglobin YjbI
MKLSQLFYDRVFDDTEKWFLNIFSSSTKQEAVENQYRFFVQTFGGPDLYRQKKGKYTRLAGRHANYPIGTNAANRWVEHMVLAIEDHDALKDDEEARKHLVNYFRYTSHYIVAAMKYMRPDQVRFKGRFNLQSGNKMNYSIALHILTHIHIPFNKCITVVEWRDANGCWKSLVT